MVIWIQIKMVEKQIWIQTTTNLDLSRNFVKFRLKYLDTKKMKADSTVVYQQQTCFKIKLWNEKLVSTYTQRPARNWGVYQQNWPDRHLTVSYRICGGGLYKGTIFSLKVLYVQEVLFTFISESQCENGQDFLTCSILKRDGNLPHRNENVRLPVQSEILWCGKIVAHKPYPYPLAYPVILEFRWKLAGPK